MPNCSNATIESVTNFHIANRSLWNYNQKWTEVGAETLQLETLRDRMRKAEVAKQPHDLVHRLDRSKVEFTPKGVPVIKFLKTSGEFSAPCIFSKRGWNALMGMIAPTRLRDWEYMAKLDDMGRKLTEMAVNKLLQTNAGDALFRTALTQVDTPDGKLTVRMVRTIQSASTRGYTAIDNLAIVEQLLLHGDFANAPILQARIEDEAFKLRFATLDIDEMKLDMGKTYGVQDVDNSEVGLGSIYIGSGGLRPVCLNGMASTSIDHQIKLIHRGSETRIYESILEDGLNVVTGAKRVQDLYNRALEIEVNDIHAQMEREFEIFAKQQTAYKLTETEKDSIYAAMSDATSSDHGCLAAGVDAMTFAAKALPLNRARDLEQLAFDYMEKSIRNSIHNVIEI